MAAEKIYEGFEHNRYEDEARERWGADAVDGAHQRMQGWSASDAERGRTGYAAVHQAAVHQGLIEEHFHLTYLLLDPHPGGHRSLAQTYLSDERFRRNIGGGDDAPVS